MKKQKGEFLISGAIMIAIFLTVVFTHKAEVEEELKNKQQTEEVKK